MKNKIELNKVQTKKLNNQIYELLYKKGITKRDSFDAYVKGYTAIVAKLVKLSEASKDVLLAMANGHRGQNTMESLEKMYA